MSAGTAEFELEQDDHVVHFYAHESDLERTVVRHLIPDDEEMGVGIVIATGEHRDRFHAGLAATGIEVGALVADGRLIWLDAAQTLRRIMPDGHLDADAFARVIGGTLRAAGAGGRAVRAYGEMVALLWDAGDVLAAIELEKLWNELSRGLRFSLLCAYPSESVAGDQHADALREVCQLHSAVHSHPHGGLGARPPEAAKLELAAHFPLELDAPRAARRFLVDGLRGWGCAGALLDDAQLVLGELAANAVLHARSGFSVRAEREQDGVLVSVRDCSTAMPILRDPSPATPTGRGLRLVAMLARAWGVEVTPSGKTVWARLSS